MKALGISQAGRPFELNVSMILEDMGWALWQRPQKEREPFEFWPQLWKGAETSYIPVEQLFLSTYIAPFQVEPLMKEQHIMVRTSFLNKRWMENGSPQPTSAKAQLLTLTKQCAYLHQRSTLSASPLSLELQVLLGSSSAPTCIPVAASVVCREGRGDIATEWDIPQMSLVRATHACELQSLFTDTIWVERGMKWSSQWTEPWGLAGDHSGATAIRLLRWQLGCLQNTCEQCEWPDSQPRGLNKSVVQIQGGKNYYLFWELLS